MLAQKDNKIQYIGNGEQTTWEIPFKFFDPTDIKVYITTPEGGETLLDEGFSVSGQIVTYPIPERNDKPLPQEHKITILRAVDQVQLLEFERKGNFDAKLLENYGLDRLTAMVQDIMEMVARCVIFPASSMATEGDAAAFLQAILGAQAKAQQAASSAAESARQAGLAAGKIVKHIERYSVGIAKDNYTGSTTEFILKKEYQPNSLSLAVFVNGVLKEAVQEYVEIDRYTIRFNYNLPDAARITFMWGINLDMPNNEAPGLDGLKAEIDALKKEIDLLKTGLAAKLEASDLIAGENITIEPILENNTTEGI